jgi:response regulator RpfG family c-di-GMP phosphodiesterase
LHDVGLIGVPDTLLAKTVARYTPPEIALFHRHAALGEQSLMPPEEMRRCKRWPR